MLRVMLAIVVLLSVGASSGLGQQAQPGTFADVREIPGTPAGARIKALVCVENAVSQLLQWDGIVNVERHRRCQ